uniref:DDE Tnp4 domain-containing protein n=1 Tax=Gadus morhua TaxID=8049 RepID=A0A8C5CCT6_GADMO
MRRSRYWVHPINQRRREQGDFHHLVAELRLDSQRHHQYFRMSVVQMEELLSTIGPELTRQSTNYRAAIEPKQRLAVGLRYLASGDSLISLAFSYRLGHTTVANSVHMVCAAIVKVMMDQFLPRPTQQMWEEVAEGYWRKTQFPNCIGAIDGKHVTIQAPPLSGSQYFNYKKYFSIVLFALVDAYCRFRVIQVGDFGRTSDGGVYANSDLGRVMESKTLHVPPSVSLPGAAQLGDVPFVMVGDAAFPLKPYLMRPYPGQNLTHPKKIYNYRLSRARRTVENAFGILAARWRIFHRKINLHPKKVDNVVIAACILHNFLLNPTDNQRYINESEQQGRNMPAVPNMGGKRASKEAHQVREGFCTFFSSPEGSVYWQDRMV